MVERDRKGEGRKNGRKDAYGWCNSRKEGRKKKRMNEKGLGNQEFEETNERKGRKELKEWRKEEKNIQTKILSRH